MDPTPVLDTPAWRNPALEICFNLDLDYCFPTNRPMYFSNLLDGVDNTELLRKRNGKGHQMAKQSRWYARLEKANTDIAQHSILIGGLFTLTWTC
ncbi:hypothetical protein F2Q69_00033969 [Brassica cretica]|uniref:Uncharacterized protein n=1 Tax=Brassica cretica TaxID=69181 RepID=A0A8S9SFF0_BRACR|nr:hypothetical protein F2Q69_00033969 [Brassica cretica]